MAYLTGFERKQAQLFPVCIDELIALDAEVRIIDLFVDSLSMDSLHFDLTENDNGRPAYHPKDLFKLYMYGYLNRIRTSRLLERECSRNIELMWLLRGLKPCFRTIAGFRSENPDGFNGVFKLLVGQLNSLGLTGRKLAAIDSSKFRAVNSKKNNYNSRKVKLHLDRIDDQINNYLNELNAGDLNDKKAADLKEKIAKKKMQRIKYKSIEKQILQSGGDQVSTTDADARSMILHGSVIEVAYNIQTAVDDKHNLITAYQATNSNDRKALLEMSIAARDACEAKKFTVLADKGYHNAQQLDACASENINTYVAFQETPRKSKIPLPEYYGDQFIFDNKKDIYTCPQGHQMKSTGRWYDKKYEQYITKVKHYKTTACKNCPVKNYCTQNPKGRVIERSQYAKAVQENKIRIESDYKTYSKRQQIIEHVFGTIKRQWGYDHILLKGLKKNQGEFGLIYFIYNFRRLLNILGPKRIKKWIKSLFNLLLNIRFSVNHPVTIFLTLIFKTDYRQPCIIEI